MKSAPLAHALVILLAVPLATGTARAQDDAGAPPIGEVVADVAMEETSAAPAAPQFGGPLASRPKLTGDWLGTRNTLAERGMTLDLYGTQFYQGVAAGGRSQEWEYGGKVDYLFNLDGQKAGLWQGFFLNMHAETRFGNSVNNIDGLLAPANIAMQFPAPDQAITSITGLKLTQALSENFVVYTGKINTLDEYVLRFSPELGLERPGIGGFQNTSFVFNPILARTVPYSAAAAGAAVLVQGAPFLAVTVFDPRERATIGLQDLYTQGVTIAPELQLRTKFLGRPGTYDFGGTYSNSTYRSLEPASYLSLPVALLLDPSFVPQESSSWCLYANFYQSIWVDPDDEKRTWGLFGQFGLSDGNPNPIRYVTSFGIAGRSMLPRRTLDTFGMGFFYLGLSDQFKTLARPILPQQNEYGLELFYNYALTPWARFTTDLQLAEPSTKGFDTVIIPGFRLEVVF